MPGDGAGRRASPFLESFCAQGPLVHSRTRFRSEPSAFSSFSPKVELRLRSPEAVRRVIGYNASTMQT